MRANIERFFDYGILMGNGSISYTYFDIKLGAYCTEPYNGNESFGVLCNPLEHEKCRRFFTRHLGKDYKNPNFPFWNPSVIFNIKLEVPEESKNEMSNDKKEEEKK